MACPAERRRASGRLIPEGEHPCIWMEAGLVAYKLCNYEYECERCPFDAEMKKSGTSREESFTEARGQAAGRDNTTEPGPRVCLAPLMAEDCFYHIGHTWVRMESGSEGRGGRVRLGVDDFAAKVLPRAKDAIVPHKGSTISQGHVFCWIVCSSNTLPFVAPLSGTVSGANPHLSACPHLINADPYGEGWLISLDASDLKREMVTLMRGKSATSWMDRERRKFERLASLLGWTDLVNAAPRSKADIGLTLADGGEMLMELTDTDVLKRYFDFINQFFLYRFKVL